MGILFVSSELLLEPIGGWIGIAFTSPLADEPIGGWIGINVIATPANVARSRAFADFFIGKPLLY